jgi:hypothetical protein
MNIRSVTHLRKALALVFLAVLGPTFMPSGASAAEARWSCNPLAPSTWCRSAYARNFIEVGSVETYAGSVPMCVKGIRQSNGTQYQGMACGYDAVGIRYTTHCNCGGLYALNNHSAPSARNIYGYGEYPG